MLFETLCFLLSNYVVTRICVISDTHSFHRQLDGISCDLMLVAGDFSLRRTEVELIDFLQWIRENHSGDVALISGNHDRYYWKNRERFFELMTEFDITYLENSITQLQGLKIWGSPITPPSLTGLNRRFEMAEDMRNSYWITIPENIDIVMTHCPPLHILDYSEDRFLGCASLREQILKVKPRYHVFGHIHSAYGIMELDGITFINAALSGDVTEGIVNIPFYIDIEK